MITMIFNLIRLAALLVIAFRWTKPINAMDVELVKEICSNQLRKCFSLYYHEQGINWEHANTACAQERNGSLVAIEYSEVQMELEKALLQDKVFKRATFAWIGGQESLNNAWHWLDGTPYEESLNQRPDNYRTCAVLQPDSNITPRVSSVNCTDAVWGFICQKPEENVDCTDGQHVQLDSTFHCMSHSQSRLSWYQAYNKCSQHGLRLSVLSNDRMKNDHTNYLRNLTEVLKRSVWIGLRRRRWEWISLRQRGRHGASFSYTNWIRGQPSKIYARCLIIDITQGSWSDHRCDDYLNLFICENQTDTSPRVSDGTTWATRPSNSTTLSGAMDITKSFRIITSPSVNNADRSSQRSITTNTGTLNSDTIIIISVLVPLAVILSIVIAVLLFLLRRRSKREQSNSTCSNTYATTSQHQPSTDYANALPGEPESQPHSYYNSALEFGTASTDTIVSDYAEIGNLPDITHRGPTPKCESQISTTVTGTEQPHSPLVMKPPIATKPTYASSYNTISGPRMEPDDTPGPSTTPLHRSPSKMERVGKAFQRVKSKLPNIRRTDPPNAAPKKTLIKPASGSMKIEHTGAFGQTATLDENHKVAPKTGDIYALVVKSNRSSELELRENPLYGTSDDL